ncbi:MAG: hypothetical protein M1818_008472 [Claussenomyces sp. TS43310]|nr:MAG: hypothetical protein M1818_008472 [Claussenomyces sp. TS43310]
MVIMLSYLDGRTTLSTQIVSPLHLANTASIEESERTATLKEALQSTRDQLFEMAFVVSRHRIHLMPDLPQAIKIGMGMGIFNAMADARGAATTADGWREKTGVDALLNGSALRPCGGAAAMLIVYTVMEMRMLVAMKLFEETGQKTRTG